MTARTLTPLAIALGIAFTASALAQQPTYYNGVRYDEITDLGAPRIDQARPQLGNASFPQTAARPIGMNTRGYVPNMAPADQRPSLASYAPPVIQPGATNYAPQMPTPNRLPYQGYQAYGYGYTPVGCNWAQPTPGYGNTLPAVNYQPLMGGAPAGGGFMPFNPYAQQQTQPFWRPLVPIKGMPANHQIGQGLIGQPKIYVPNQPVRNFLRYITP